MVTHNAPVAPRGAGGQGQPKLEGVAERAVAERQGVVDGQGCEPDGGGSGGAAQQTGLKRKHPTRGAAVPHTIEL